MGLRRHTARLRPIRDREGITRANPNADVPSFHVALAVVCYGHPYADDSTPAPPIRPEPEPRLSAQAWRQNSVLCGLSKSHVR